MSVFTNFYYLGYCTALFITPVVLYIVFRRRNEYRRRDWFYYIKFQHAKNTVRKMQQKNKKEIQSIGDDLDYKIFIPSDQHTSSHFIYGVDQKGNSISVRFTLHLQRIAEVFLYLRLSNGKRYILPGNDKIHFFTIPKLQWKANGLNMEILEPFRRLRLTFNGLLKEVSTGIGTVEHVQFNFIWNTASSPLYFPEDVSEGLIAEALATEHWKDADWMSFLPDTSGYEQFGALQGFVKTEYSSEEIVLVLPSYRTKIEGVRSTELMSREVRICLASEDGTCINLTLECLNNGCSQFAYGFVIKSCGKTLPISKTDILLKRLGDRESLPDSFTAHISAGKKVYRAAFHLNLPESIKVTNNDENGYDLYHVPCEVDLDSNQAKGMVEFWYSKEGNEKIIPKDILTEKIVPKLPNDLVLSIRDPKSQILDLTGGKGCSLALMSSLKQNYFNIPGGFIVTTNAFKEHLDENWSIKNSVLSLDDICCGRKSGKLEDACKKTVDSFISEEITEKIGQSIRDELKKHSFDENGLQNGRWAVRSSAIGEDSEDLSAAGQNETFLGCKAENDVLDAIKKCWASLFTYQSVQYRWQHGLPVQTQMAVVVQKMVPAESAGVMFTCHPTTCNPSQMVITSNFGLGESVVSAKSDPDTIILKKDHDGIVSVLEKNIGRKETCIHMNEKNGVEEVGINGDSDTMSLKEEQSIKLGKVGVYLEKKFAGPRDIEWAFYKDHLYLLQSRPVTTLNSWTDFELLHELDAPIMTEQNIYTLANVGEVYPGATTVLSQTTSQYFTSKSVQIAIDGTYNPYTKQSVTSLQHRVMLNVIDTFYKIPKEKDDVSIKVMDLAIFGHPVVNEKIKKIAIARYGAASRLTLLKELFNFIKQAWNSKKSLAKMLREMGGLKIEFRKDQTLKEMHDVIDDAIERLGFICTSHCGTTNASIFYQIIAINLLLENNTDISLDHCSDCALILSSCHDVVSAEVPAVLEEIAFTIQEEKMDEEFQEVDPEDGVKFLEEKCPKAHKILTDFLEKHGHRALKEFELQTVPWGTKPSTLIKILQISCKTMIVKKDKMVSTSVGDIVSQLVTPKKPWTKILLKFFISKMRVSVGLREKTKSEVIRGCDKIRVVYRKLAEKMVMEGIIPNKDLIFHLTHHEVRQLIANRNPSLLSKAMRRQRLYPKWDSMRFEEIIYGIPEAEVESEFVYGDGDVCVSGTPVCAGDVKARACVITSLNDIGQLETGDILITFATDIGWSPYFPMLSGVVTELGGLVSHGAVVAREYGLPCIVGVKHATKIFKTGDIVQLSGKYGKIEAIKS
ncbi:unnamed protein product [Brassicogethes aeneus]|uniref:Phosphoenolpyruvate synthase n=1 Tax=Brassicogethes aeneus TaxID=1431903 RepID=A0A9P0FBN6_BRAAE|nr:unnamed protein product [Brassicogethes aeneus]